MNLASTKSAFGQQRRFLNQIDKDLECSICHDVYVEPTRQTCRHTFCKKCICEWISKSVNPRCPICNKLLLFKRLQVDKQMATAVNGLAVQCRYDPCQWRGNLLASRRHERKCQYSKKFKHEVLVISDDNEEVQIISEQQFKLEHPREMFTVTFLLKGKEDENSKI